MRKTALFLSFLLLVAVSVSAQQDDGWDQLQTADGEFSAKLPAGCYSHFYDPNGITVWRRETAERFRLSEMHLISCFADQTLMSVEIYENDRPRQAIKALAASLKINGDEVSSESASEDDFFGIHQVENKNGLFSFRYFMAGKKHIYFITMAKRGPSSKTTDIFAKSLKVFPAADRSLSTKPAEKIISISSLKNDEPKIVDETLIDEKLTMPVVTAGKIESGPTLKKLVVLSIPKPSYAGAARRNNVSGRVSLRLSFAADGTISWIRVRRGLPDGLLREAVIAALRIKFLPEERDGKPLSADGMIEYVFSTH